MLNSSAFRHFLLESRTMGRTLQLSDSLADYLERTGQREHPVQRECRAETAAMGRIAMMQIGPDQGALIAMLVRILGARRVLEIGTFTGYSSLTMALAMPPDGRV